RSAHCVESEIVKRTLRGRQFDLSVELHEDIDSPGFYMYEIKSQPPFLGGKIVEAVERVGPVNRVAVIEGMRSVDGVIRRPNATSQMMRRKRWPLAFYLYSYHTPHKLTLETPGPKPLELRVK